MRLKSFVFIIAVFLLNVSLYQPALAQLTMPAIGSNAGIETTVQAYFANAPEMIVIAKCESGFRQYDNSGSPLRGGGGRYIGIFQISEGHAATAQSLGLDMYTTDGNIAYAKYLYDKQGTAPWSGCIGS